MQEVTFSPGEVEKATQGRRVAGGEKEPLLFTGISIDSRTVRRGQLFVAIHGKRFDGHDFLEAAFEQGAAGAVVDRWPLKGIATGRSIWQVPETLRALGDLARFHRSRFSIEVAAITGSSGKTTTKGMLAHLLSENWEVLSTPGTQNNLIGVPMTLLQLHRGHRAAVLELGTNQWGEIRRLAEILRPTIGMVTNIGPAHLQAFGSLEGVLRAKGELWKSMDPQAPLILNADDPLLRRAAERLGPRVTWFGMDPRADVRISQAEGGSWGSRCFINGRWKLELPLPGRHSLLNAAAALACAQRLGRDLAGSVRRLQTVPSISGRLTVREQDGVLFLDDSYNANPASLQAALEVLVSVERPGRKILVVGDMLELGDQAEALHEEMGRSVAHQVDLLVAVGGMAHRLLSSAQEAGLPREAGQAFKTSDEAGEFLMPSVRSGDTVLIKGSRGMQMERVLACCTTFSIR